jgi:formylglycine-generating enzyme required for sulfatase activity
MDRQGARKVSMAVVGALALTAAVAAPSGQEITVTLPGNVPLAFVRIPAGTFSMGSPSGERNRGDDEAQHQVTLTRDYYIGKFEVTQAQWQAVMGSNPSYFKSGGDYPVEQISWIDITEDGGFLARLNRHLTSTGQPGAGRMRLPTEAEWERAARGGTTTRFSYGDALDCDDFCKPCTTHAQYMRWCGNNKPGRPDEVGRRKPNPFGLYDVHGDVFEWVQDWYGPYSSSAQKDPKGPWKGSDRVIRGGRSDSPAHWCRAAYRGIKSPDGRDAHTGLRLAWSP